MKQTWKKFVGLLLAVICTFGLTACGNNGDEFVYITDDVVLTCEQTATALVEQLAAMTDEELQSYIGSKDDFTRVTMEAWVEGKAVMGNMVSMDSDAVESEINEEDLQVTVKIPSTFENNSGTVTMVFNYDKESNSPVPAYTTIAEQETFAGNMKSAAVNTVMGVGTVFTVLIFLVFVISLFKYVGKIGGKKEEPKKVVQKAAPVAAPAEEDQTDDLELVAVIAAAIAASENTSTDSFVVRSIKKVNRSKWQRA